MQRKSERPRSKLSERRTKLNPNKYQPWPYHASRCARYRWFTDNKSFLKWANDGATTRMIKSSIRVLGRSDEPETIIKHELPLCCPEAILQTLECMLKIGDTPRNDHWHWLGYCERYGKREYTPAFGPLMLITDTRSVRRYLYERTWGKLPPRCRLAACPKDELCVCPTHAYPMIYWQRDQNRTPAWWYKATEQELSDLQRRMSTPIGKWPEGMTKEKLWKP